MPKILIIEDEGLIIELLQRKLEKEGYDVSIAKNEEEAIMKLKEIWPDLVLLNVHMQKGEGVEIMEKINKTPTLQRIPVIAMVDAGDSFELRRAQELGVKDWIIKTEFDLQQIIEKVVKQIGR